jgi:hypothetical protein
LKKLELVTKSLGSAVVISYKEILGLDDMEDSRQQSLRRIQEELLKNVPEQPTEFMQLYRKLGM